jgi:hypothetical protein
MYAMTTATIQSTGLRRAPKLRLLAKAGSSAHREAPASHFEAGRPALRLLGVRTPDAQPVLLSGGDADARATLMADLARTLAPGTVFEQADAIWEMLMRAPQSRMVVLSGELDGLAPESLRQLLAHRFPGLLVVCLDSPGADRARSSVGSAYSHAG